MGEEPSAEEEAKSVVIVPGFMCGHQQYAEMAEAMGARGVRAAVVPIEWYHWLPTMATNSYRPILDAIEHTVQHVAHLDDGSEPVTSPSQGPRQRSRRGSAMMASKQLRPIDVPPLPTSLAEMLLGKSSTDASSREPTAAKASSSVALVAHSAGGWLSRLYLSPKEHYGATWNGAQLVSALVTLGSPHEARMGPMAPHVKQASEAGALPAGVRCLAVASKGVLGKASALAAMSYHICAGPFADVVELDGDGITNVQAALQVPGADQLVLDRINHMPDSLMGKLVTPESAQERPWYGSESTLDEWLPWLQGRQYATSAA